MNGFANAYEYVKMNLDIIIQDSLSAVNKKRIACGIICIINAICQFISYNIVSNDIKKKNFFA